VKDGDLPFNERQVNNLGESLFEIWAKENNVRYQRNGTDQTNNLIPNFFKLSPTIRKSPDYISWAVRDKGIRCALFCVKGTENFKHEEYEIIDWLIKTYETEEWPIIYAFFFKNYEPIFKTANEVKSLFENAGQDYSWPDGKRYRKLGVWPKNKDKQI